MGARMSATAPVRFRRIVVGFDGSASACAALEWAVEEARLHGGALEVWAVADSGRLGVRSASDEMSDLRELRVVAEQVAEGTGADLRLKRGDAAAVLCAGCDAADLLVVGSRGRNPLAGLLLGSVSQACLGRAPCPVVVVGSAPKPPRPHGRVVVGIDTWDEAGLVLLVAAREARLRAAELEVVHAFSWNQLHDPDLIRPVTQQLLSWAGDLMGEALADTGVAGRALVVNGNAADVLVRHSAAADVLVLASHGHRALTARTLGSTSETCARKAKCPVMIVRPDDRKGDDAATR